MLYLKLQKGIQRIEGMVTSPHPTKIKRINFAITYRCNSHCKICSIWKKYNRQKELIEQEMYFNQIYHLFNQSKYLEGLEEINLTGGEPFLREDFKEIYRFFRKRYPRATIIINTNGLDTQQFWLETSNDIFQSILVFSIDGLQETNDAIRGVQGSYQRVMDAIDYYKEHYPLLKMGLSFTVQPENYLELKEIYALSRKLDFSFTMRFACSSKTYYENANTIAPWSEKALTQLEWDIHSIIEAMAESRNILNRLLNPDLFFFSQMVHYQRNQKRLFPCHSGVHSFFLDPFGNIYPCIFSEQQIGNMTKESFDQLWVSSVAKEQRCFIAEGKCHCWTECETIPSLRRDLRHFIPRWRIT